MIWYNLEYSCDYGSCEAKYKTDKYSAVWGTVARFDTPPPNWIVVSYDHSHRLYCPEHASKLNENFTVL